MKNLMLKYFVVFSLITVFAGSSLSAAEQRKDQSLEIARSLAKAYCFKFEFPADKIAQLDNPPLSVPSALKRDNREVTVYRWLGNGRGDYIVQVEVYKDDEQVTVLGGYAHRDFGLWVFKTAKTTKE